MSKYPHSLNAPQHAQYARDHASTRSRRDSPIIETNYRVVALGIRYSITYACTGAYHKDTCSIQGNTEGTAIGGLLLHCQTAAGKVVDADALALEQTKDMQLTAADAESNVGPILRAVCRVYTSGGELAEAEIPDIGIRVNDIHTVGSTDCQFLAHGKTWFGGEGKGHLCAVFKTQDNALLCPCAKDTGKQEHYSKNYANNGLQ